MKLAQYFIADDEGVTLAPDTPDWFAAAVSEATEDSFSDWEMDIASSVSALIDMAKMANYTIDRSEIANALTPGDPRVLQSWVNEDIGRIYWCTQAWDDSIGVAVHDLQSLLISGWWMRVERIASALLEAVEAQEKAKQ